MLNFLMFIGVLYFGIVEEYNYEVGDFCGKVIIV